MIDVQVNDDLSLSLETIRQAWGLETLAVRDMSVLAAWFYHSPQCYIVDHRHA